MAKALGGDMDALVESDLALQAPDPARIVVKVPVTAEGTATPSRPISTFQRYRWRW